MRAKYRKDTTKGQTVASDDITDNSVCVGACTSVFVRACACVHLCVRVRVCVRPSVSACVRMCVRAFVRTRAYVIMFV